MQATSHSFIIVSYDNTDYVHLDCETPQFAQNGTFQVEHLARAAPETEMSSQFLTHPFL